MPARLMLSLGFGVAAVEQRVVIVEIEVMGLQPNAGRINRVAMGGEASVPAVDIGADVLGAVDDLVAVMGNLANILLAAVALENPAEIGVVAIGPPGPIFGRNDRVHGVGHRRVIGW